MKEHLIVRSSHKAPYSEKQWQSTLSCEEGFRIALS